MIQGLNKLIASRRSATLTVALLVGLGWLIYRNLWPRPIHTDAPTWTHNFPGRGTVYSIAAERRSDGSEIVVAGGYAVTDSSGNDMRIVAFMADTGQILWEHRESRSISPYINSQPIVSFDADGNILCGEEITAIGKGIQPSLTKLSVKDGAEVWRWSPMSYGGSNPFAGYGHMARAAGLSHGHIWVSGIRLLAERTYERFVALVDSQSGNHQWLISLNAADDVFDRQAEVTPLAHADAIVMSPPRHHEKSYPWIWQRIDGVSGSSKWKREFVRDNDRNLERPFYIVDESKGQMLIFWHQVIGGRWQGEVISIDLTTGVERWRNPSAYMDHFSWGMRGVGISSSGDPVLFGAETWTTTKTNWFHWEKDPEIPFPLPTMTGQNHIRPISVTLSAIDGRIDDHRRLSEHDEAPTRLLYEPYSQKAKVMFVRTMITRDQTEPWRAIRLDGVKRTPRPGGAAGKSDYPRVSTMTPSGRVITTGDPTEKEVTWRIEAW
jgi:outer membrane protein assembly factor BamB